MCLVSKIRMLLKMLCECLEREMGMMTRHLDGFMETKSCQTKLISFVYQDYLAQSGEVRANVDFIRHLMKCLRTTLQI